MENREEILISFDDMHVDEANKLAQKLKQHLLIEEALPSNIIKESKDTMDFGATLAIILGSEAIVALAKGIASFIAGSHRSVTIRKKTITTVDGKENSTVEVVAKNVSSNYVEKILKII